MASIKPEEMTAAQPLLDRIDDLIGRIDDLLSVGKGGRVKLSDIGIDYPAGLHSLVRNLVLEIRDIPVAIEGIHYGFGQLEVGFHMLKQRNELRVWKAINKARQQSHSACQGCGGYARRKVVGDKVIVICSDCQKALDSQGKTGTWLDKY